MAITFKIKRGTSTQHAVYTGQAGELTMTTDSGTESVRLHDGTTQGGIELARKDLKNLNIPVGGVNFEYYFETSPPAIETGIGTGRVGFNNADPSAATTLYASETDVYGTSLLNFLNTIGTVSNAVLGHFKLYRKSDASKFMIFEVTKSVDGTNQFEFTVSQQAESITDFDDNELIILSYIDSGIDSITAFLSKSDHAFPSDSLGRIDSGDYAEGVIKVGVFLGLSNIEADITSPYTPGSYNAAATIVGGGTPITLTPSIDSSDNQLIFTPSAFANATDSVKVKITITITGFNGQTKDIDREIVYSKNKQGRTAEATSDDFQIAYDESGKNPDPTSYILTARGHGFKDPYFRIKETNPDVIRLTTNASFSLGSTFAEDDIIHGETSRSIGTIYIKEADTSGNHNYIVTNIREGIDSSENNVKFLAETIHSTTGNSFTVTNENLAENSVYKIITLGTTNWSDIGASASPKEGEVFTKNSTAASATGTHGSAIQIGKRVSVSLPTTGIGAQSKFLLGQGISPYGEDGTPTDEEYPLTVNSPTYKFSRRNYTIDTFEGPSTTASGTGNVLAQDKLTVFGTKSGDGNITAFFQNPVVSFRSNESKIVGDTDYDIAATIIEVYEGNTALDYRPTATAAQVFNVDVLPEGTWAVKQTEGTQISTTNITVAGAAAANQISEVSGNTYQAQIEGSKYSGMLLDNASVSVTIKLRTKTGKLEERTITQNLNRLATGDPSQTMELSSDADAFTFNKSEGPKPTTQEILFTAFNRNLDKFSNSVTPSGNFISGRTYKILSIGNTSNWSAWGGPESAAVNDTFTATGVGSAGAGTASPYSAAVWDWQVIGIKDAETTAYVGGIPATISIVSGSAGTGYANDFSDASTTGSTLGSNNLKVSGTASDGVIQTVTIASAGNGYWKNEELTITGGNGDAKIKINTVTGPTNLSLTTVSGQDHQKKIDVADFKDDDDPSKYLKQAKVRATVTFTSDADGGTTTLVDGETIAGRKDAKDSFTIDVSQENINYATTEAGKILDDYVAQGTSVITVHEGLDQLVPTTGNVSSLTESQFHITLSDTTHGVGLENLDTDTIDVSNKTVSIKPKTTDNFIDWDYTAAGTSTNAGSFTVNKQYKIASIGTTDFTAIGASANTVGILFTATGAGSGSGTAETTQALVGETTVTITIKPSTPGSDNVQYTRKIRWNRLAKGALARRAQITANDYIITYKNNGTGVTEGHANLVLTATAYNYNDPVYQFKENGTDLGDPQDTNTKTITLGNSSAFAEKTTYSVEITEDASATSSNATLGTETDATLTKTTDALTIRGSKAEDGTLVAALTNPIVGINGTGTGNDITDTDITNAPTTTGVVAQVGSTDYTFKTSGTADGTFTI